MQRQGGFTLIEALIVLVLMGLVASLGATSISQLSTLSARLQKTTTETDDFATGHVLLKRAFAHTLPVSARIEEEDIALFGGDETSLYFPVSALSLADHRPASFVRVIQQDDLLIAEITPLIAKAESHRQILARDIATARWSYLIQDKDGKEETGWRDHWKGSDGLALAARLDVTDRSGHKRQSVFHLGGTIGQWTEPPKLATSILPKAVSAAVQP